MWEQHIHPDDADRVIAETRYAFRQQKAFDCEYRMIAADGSVVWVWERDTVIRDEVGEPYLTQGIITDVTATRIAEAALAESEERNRGVVHALEEGLLIYGSDGRVLSVQRGRDADPRPRRGGHPLPHAPGTGRCSMRAGGRHAARARGDALAARAADRCLPQRDVVMKIVRPDGTEVWASVSSHRSCARASRARTAR